MTLSSEPTYYLPPSLQALDPSAREVDPNAYTWVQTTIIEDDDLIFGGKALCTWFEEERRPKRRGRVWKDYSKSGRSHKTQTT
ncbi:hypothetical protein LCI18_013307 [Fusarium solani-melongenae]|uniref:Uncharacterized protein n=1 Tax=Fusarium solani subsp. cucurbitae TaxID=2747967 RepID=A0ACD3ZN53_FUSSC|nr:hypothetical protein LCI18_013307 [Fusarium solani-melongenae]